MTRAATTLACVLCALALGACGRDSSSGEDASQPVSTTGETGETRTVERNTRVEVVKESGEAEGFDPEGIYRREAPGVVTIISAGLAGASTPDQGAGQGSGFVINEDGEVVTNAHVVTSGVGPAIRKAQNVYVRFQDGNQVPARIVGFDPFSDVALLKIDPAGLTLRPLPLGSTDDVVVGAPVAAIGSPFGEEQSLSIGVISALDRDIQSLTGFDTIGAVQTDAAINRGNSGGPLLDARGRVLGINAQIRTTSGEGSGVGFAIPVDTVKRSIDQLRSSGRARYAYLGVATAAVYPQLAERLDLPVKQGALVQEVTDDGPADDAGLRAGEDTVRFQEREFTTGGDIVVNVAGRRVRDGNDLAAALLRFDPGQTVRLDVLRSGERERVDVKLGERPLEAPRR
jgi:S1-C subfamily serine protease